MTLSTAITCLKKPSNVIVCFQALCGEKSIASMTSIITSLNSKDAKYIDKCSDWSAAGHFVVEYRGTPKNAVLAIPRNDLLYVWTNCPLTSNAVERIQNARRNILYH